MKKRDYYYFSAIFLFFSFLAFKVIADTKTINFNGTVVVTFMLNGFIILGSLLKKSELGYSLLDIFSVFNFIFLFLSPMVQYLSGRFPWGDSGLLTAPILSKTNLIISFFLILVYLFYRPVNNKVKNKSIATHNFENIHLTLNTMFILSILSAIIVIGMTGFNNLFSRATNSMNLDIGPIGVVFTSFLKFNPVINLLFNIYYKNIKGHFYNKFQTIILFVIVLLIHFPTGGARFQIATIYVSLILMYKPKFKNKYALKIIIVLGLMFVFPFLNLFRNTSFQDVTLNTTDIFNFSESLMEGHFDSYSMLARSIYYVDEFGSTFGNQLLGVLFFFVPRSLWSSKPVGSGYFIAQQLGWDFKNVSMNLIGEGYLNFSLLGVVVVAIVLSRMMYTLDFKISIMMNFTDRNKNITLDFILYILLIGQLFFILRGDLLSSFSTTIGTLAPLLLFYFLDSLLSKKRTYQNDKRAQLY